MRFLCFCCRCMAIITHFGCIASQSCILKRQQLRVQHSCHGLLDRRHGRVLKRYSLRNYIDCSKLLWQKKKHHRSQNLSIVKTLCVHSINGTNILVSQAQNRSSPGVTPIITYPCSSINCFNAEADAPRIHCLHVKSFCDTFCNCSEVVGSMWDIVNSGCQFELYSVVMTLG